MIYLNTATIAGYTRNDVFFFMATTFVIDAIDMTFLPLESGKSAILFVKVSLI